jgi:hypothetical protein
LFEFAPKVNTLDEEVRAVLALVFVLVLLLVPSPLLVNENSSVACVCSVGLVGVAPHERVGVAVPVEPAVDEDPKLKPDKLEAAEAAGGQKRLGN